MSAPEPLDSRYRFVKALKGPAKSIVWLANDEETGSEVVCSVLPESRVKWLRPLVGLAHDHIACIRRIMSDFAPAQLPTGERPQKSSSVVIADHIVGRSMTQRLDTGPVDPARAAAWIERLADLLNAVHKTEAAHGAISPRAIVVSRVETGTAPVLTHLIVPPSGAYCSPERVMGGGPSQSDDAWALCATAYTALARKPPFEGKSRKALAEAILAPNPPEWDESLEIDLELRTIISMGLLRDPELRTTSAGELADALHAWLYESGAEVGGELGTIPPPSKPLSEAPPASTGSGLRKAIDSIHVPDAGDRLSAAAPLTDAPSVSDFAGPPTDATELGYEANDSSEPPAKEGGSSSPAAAKEAEAKKKTPSTPRPSAKPAGKEKKSSAGPLFLLLLLVAAAGGGFFAYQKGLLPPPLQSMVKRLLPGGEPREAATAAEPPATAPPPSSASAAAEEPEPIDPTACMQGYVLEGTLGKSPNLDFVCEKKDIWDVGRRFYKQVATKGRGEGVKEWVYLSRYDILAITMMRKACCPSDTPAPNAVIAGKRCGSMTEALADVEAELTEEIVAKYVEVAECMLLRKVGRPETWDRIGKTKSSKTWNVFFERSKNPRPASPNPEGDADNEPEAERPPAAKPSQKREPEPKDEAPEPNAEPKPEPEDEPKPAEAPSAAP